MVNFNYQGKECLCQNCQCIVTWIKAFQKLSVQAAVEIKPFLVTQFKFFYHAFPPLKQESYPVQTCMGNSSISRACTPHERKLHFTIVHDNKVFDLQPHDCTIFYLL